MASLGLIRNGEGKDVPQADAAVGPFDELDPPTDDNNKWRLKPGFITFFGLTGILNF